MTARLMAVQAAGSPLYGVEVPNCDTDGTYAGKQFIGSLVRFTIFLLHFLKLFLVFYFASKLIYLVDFSVIYTNGKQPFVTFCWFFVTPSPVRYLTEWFPLKLYPLHLVASHFKCPVLLYTFLTELSVL